ncbi:MAG: hypothetical protein HQM08_27840 [Candidatus Riflebacteria bacterium]|nr:hypothetical protein [Candidatus Riflebacteria bacterium]
MKQLQPVEPQTPAYPGFRPRRRFLESLAMLLRIEITLPVCLMVMLSCASLNAQTSIFNGQLSGEMLAQVVESSTDKNEKPNGLPCKGAPPVIEQPSPPTPSEENTQEPNGLQNNEPQKPKQTDPLPCKGDVISEPLPCSGEQMPAPLVQGVQPAGTVEPVPCKGKVSAVEPNTPSQIGNPGTSFRDLSLDEAIANPGGFIGMRVRLQGFFGTYSGNGQSGSFLGMDIPLSNATQPTGLLLEIGSEKLKCGAHYIVEGTLTKVVSTGSRTPIFKLKVENIRTR